ncbi:MAG: hypothetical protein HW381_192 [Candidatus Rokubacteria bacterium]|nr:hypothetical protein [Candidatus Rokubacteria bacterium]
MIHDLKLLNEEFASPVRTRARSLPNGFLVAESRYPALRGRIVAWTLIRKLFESERLVCWSNNGERSTTGQACALCPSRPACSRRLRLDLEEVHGERADGRDRLGALTLELNFTSCRNFLAYALRLGRAHLDVPDLPARLTVVERGGWGEVCFLEAPDPVTVGEAEHA